MGRICQMGLRITSHAVWRKVGLIGWQVLQKLKFCGVGGGSNTDITTREQAEIYIVFITVYLSQYYPTTKDP